MKKPSTKSRAKQAAALKSAPGAAGAGALAGGAEVTAALSCAEAVLVESLEAAREARIKSTSEVKVFILNMDNG